MTVSITIVASGKPGSEFRQIRKRADKPHPALEKVGGYMRKTFVKQFATEGAYSGRRWKALKPTYAARKARIAKGKKILQLDGDLRRSFMALQDSYTRINVHSAEFGSQHPLAKYHQFGTHSHRTGKQIVPARPVVVKTPRMVYDVARIFERHLLGEIRGSQIVVNEP